MGDDLDSSSFNKNYRLLKETADWLSGQKEPDIDRLVPKVETAMKAYAICKDRLDKVQATLGQYFQKDGAVPESTPLADDNGRAIKASGPAPNPEDDENIPF
jgi:exodeoxyribonuclease VII small subunit